jgi:hypothetical protein
MIPLTIPHGARRRISKNQRVEVELLKIRAANHPRFCAMDLAKRTNHCTNGIGNILRFTTGVRCRGKGLWELTEDPIKVLA